MSPTINMLLGRAYLADLRRARDRHDVMTTPVPDEPAPPIDLRLAGPEDARLVRRLAALDDAPELAGAVLFARVGGEPVAALSLADGRVVADPFRLTGDVVALLRLRAAHLETARPAPARRRARRSRRRGDAIVPCSE